jgi:hypothetical protein
VAFDAAGRRSRVSPADSAAFWEIARGVERAVGDSLFHPATAADLQGDGNGILVKVDRAIDGSGLTLISWTERGRAYDASVYLRTPALLRDPRVVAHELVHALGFGHTGSWLSIMGPAADGVSLPTATDVAHMQLLLRVQELQERHDAPYGVAEALEPAAVVSRRPN